MDGYAVRAADVAGATHAAPVKLPVLETVRAGQRPTRPLAPRTAIRIMTGAPVPAGAPLTTMAGGYGGKGDPIAPPAAGAPVSGQPLLPGPHGPS